MNAKELITELEAVISELFEDSIHQFMELEFLDEETVKESEKNKEDYSENDREVLTRLGPFEQKMNKRTGSEMRFKSYVYHFKAHDIYLQIDGDYSSWTGTEFNNDWYEVKPEEITTVVYKRVK